MNFLAHLYLADTDDSDSVIGNMLADFITPPVERHYSAAVRRGIRRHRRIDRYTDHHPLFRRSTARISGKYRLLRGIMVDLFYDHFLARHWADYHSIPLESFCEQVYGHLTSRKGELPERMQLVVTYMVRDNWLVSYRDLTGIQWALSGLSRRLSRPTPLHEGIEELHRNYAGLEADFRAFFPELVAFVEDLRQSETSEGEAGDSHPPVS